MLPPGANDGYVVSASYRISDMILGFGKATTSSDIDLLIVGTLDFASAVKALYSAQDTLSREINPKLYSTLPKSARI